MANLEEKTIEQLGEITECPICMSAFNDPRMLPCIHTFCFECLKRTAETAEKKPGDRMPCPLCWRDFTIPEDGMNDLQKNFFIENLLQLKATLQIGSAIPVCDMCNMGNQNKAGDITKATMKCLECQDHYCDSCVKFHQFRKLSRNHQLVKIGIDTASEMHQPVAGTYCCKHQQKPLHFYCADCKKLVCISCFVESHKSHNCKDVTILDEEFRQTIQGNSSKVSSYAYEMLSLKRNAEIRKADFLRKVYESENTIYSRNQELKDIIDDHTKVLLTELSVIKSKNLKKMEIEMQEIDRYCTILKSFEEYCTEMILKGSASDICASVDQIIDRANELESDRAAFVGRAHQSFEESPQTIDLTEVLQKCKHLLGQMKDINVERSVIGLLSSPPATEAEIFRQPLCLVESGSEGEMTVNTKVLNQLKRLDKEVVVVAIAGQYRTGKSYLMNRLAGENKGFAIGSTVQSKTKGIWIWVKNHPKSPDTYLVLLDTEGLDDVEKGDDIPNHQILCLSVLLASTLVYNVMGVIGKEAITTLQFITELSKHIQARGGDSDSDDSNFDFYFPDFVYAIRDFGLDLEIDGEEVTADEYLEHALKMKKGTSKQVKHFNKTRSCIRKYFKKRKCFTFVKPMDGKCKNLDDVTDDKLDPDFLKDTKAFLNFINLESPVKVVGGKRLSGRMLGSLLEIYVEQMKTGVSYVENAFETMARLESSQAMEEASALYYNLMLESLNMPVDDDDEFSRCHNTCFQKAIDLFLSKAVFHNDHTFQIKLNEDIYKKYRDLLQTKEDSWRDTCQTALTQLFEPINEGLKAGQYARSGGFRLYKNAIRDFEEEYKLRIGRIGDKMPHVLLEFLHSKQTEEDEILNVDEMVTEAEKQEEVERQKASEAQRHKDEMKRATDLHQQQLKEQELAHAKNIKGLEMQMNQHNETTQERHEKVLDHRVKENERLQEEGFTKEANEMCGRINELRGDPEQKKKSSPSKWCPIL